MKLNALILGWMVFPIGSSLAVTNVEVPPICGKILDKVLDDSGLREAGKLQKCVRGGTAISGDESKSYFMGNTHVVFRHKIDPKSSTAPYTIMSYVSMPAGYGSDLGFSDNLKMTLELDSKCNIYRVSYGRNNSEAQVSPTICNSIDQSMKDLASTRQALTLATSANDANAATTASHNQASVLADIKKKIGGDDDLIKKKVSLCAYLSAYTVARNITSNTPNATNGTTSAGKAD